MLAMTYQLPRLLHAPGVLAGGYYTELDSYPMVWTVPHRAGHVYFVGLLHFGYDCDYSRAMASLC